MRRKVDSLKAMKSLMERVDRAQAEPDDTTRDPTRPEAGASQPAAPAPSPQELLAQARELRDSILRIEQAAQAKKLAEVLKLPPEQALEKVKQQAAEAARRDAAQDAKPLQTPEQVDQALARYEQQARESLQRLQTQRAQEQQGTPTQREGGSAGASSHQGQGAGPGGQVQPGGDNGPTRDPLSGAGSQGNAGGQSGQGGVQGAGGGAPGGTAGRADGRQSSVQDTEPRRYDGAQATEAINAKALRLGAGNTLGPGGVWANRVYVDRWYLIGPFPAPKPGSIHTVYPPEQWVDLDGVYLGKGQRVLRWQYVSSAAYPLVPPDYAEQAIYYGHTEITSDRDRKVWLALGADDDAKLWLNDQLVWTSGNQRKAWYTNGGVQSLKEDIQAFNLIEDRRLVQLRKGRNTLLFKLYNNPLDVFFSLVIEPAGDGR
jgi:hypothetical protein